MRRAVAIAWVLLATLACAQPVLRRDWSQYDGPGAGAFQREQPPAPYFADPLEPLNRSSWALNHALIVGIIDPLSRVYRFVTPRFARDRIRDFSANLVFPRNFVTNLLQWRWRSAGTEFQRFAINTTIGLAGLWDPATRVLEIPAAPEDFGQVFARWGWRPSTFLMLPLAGPSSVRDAIGLVPDAYLDPATYFFPASWVLTFNELSDSVPSYRRFARSSFDPYDDARMVWSLAREARIEEPEPQHAPADTGATQTLVAAFLGPRDPGFAESLCTREVALTTSGRALPYSFRMQPGHAPLVLLVPGLGSHRLASSSLALAEMVWDKGFSVAIVSSAMNFEFIERGASVPLPGHAPVDARDVHVALDAVARDLALRYPDRIGARVFLGISLGAFHGFFIAAQATDPKGELIRFDRFALLDPPVRLFYGMRRLDDFYDVPLALPEPERAAEVRRILLKAASVARQAMAGQLGTGSQYSRVEASDLSGGTMTPEIPLPFSNDEAKFLIGVAFRRSLQSLLYASQEREDQGVLLTERRRLRRLPAYQEISDYSFEMYLYAFVLPYYRDQLHQIASAEELVAKNDLHALAAGLRANPALRVFVNENDFLTNDADLAWLSETIGSERVRISPTGGHLGNLQSPAVQAEILASLADLVADGAPAQLP